MVQIDLPRRKFHSPEISNRRNKNAFGICNKCQASEHFSCAGTPPQMKEDIKQNIAKFLCSNCFEENPLLGKQMLMCEDEQSNGNAIDVDLIESDAEDTDAITLVESIVVHKEPSTALKKITYVEKKSISCDGCSFVTNEGEELRLHIQEVHTPVQIDSDLPDAPTETKTNANFKCNYCLFETNTDESLSLHETSHHGVCCNDCKSLFSSQNELDDHVPKCHKPEFKCSFCSFVGKDQNSLVNHINYRHKESNFVCHDCDYTEKDKIKVRDHIKKNHTDKDDADILALKNSLKSLNESYDRLNNLYSKMKAEAADKDLGYKIQLAEAQDQFKVLKAENEKLKETNRIQENLWKIWLEKFEKEKIENSNQLVSNDNTVENDEENDGEDDDVDIEAWFQQNKNRGFKRVISDKTDIQRNIEKSSTAVKVVKETTNMARKYCHNFNNKGKCDIKECKFLHKQAPVCKFDGKCNRKKCMFRHVHQNVLNQSQNLGQYPNQPQHSGNFLPLTASFPQMSPWSFVPQMMNQWLMSSSMNPTRM